VLDIPGSGKPRDKPFRARAMGLWLVGHHPIRSRSDDVYGRA